MSTTWFVRFVASQPSATILFWFHCKRTQSKLLLVVWACEYLCTSARPQLRDHMKRSEFNLWLRDAILNGCFISSVRWDSAARNENEVNDDNDEYVTHKTKRKIIIFFPSFWFDFLPDCVWLWFRILSALTSWHLTFSGKREMRSRRSHDLSH